MCVWWPRTGGGHLNGGAPWQIGKPEMPKGRAMRHKLGGVMKGNMVNIGASRDTVKEIKDLVCAILRVREADEGSKVAAIQAVMATIKVGPVTISGCSFESGL